VNDGSCQTFVSDCQVTAATALVSHRWDPVVLSALREGPVRRADLLPRIAGISDKVLTDSLRRLLANRLVEKSRGGPGSSGGGPAVYRLSPLGESFVEGPLRSLARWAVDHGGELAGATVDP
jgi:DNA-binding HxlR family transcriptional regulator